MSNQYIMAKWTDDDYKAYLKGRCIVSDSGCWLFQGFCHKPPRNYGNISHRGKKWATHRLTYFLYKGSIPKGMVVMHSCDTPPCCNPDHLELGTHLQNMADCRAKNRYHYANLTHCKRGHEFNEKNTYIIKTPGEAFGLRGCKVCMLGHTRIRAGWPEEWAYREDVKVPKGYRLVFETGEMIPSARKRQSSGAPTTGQEKP